MTTAGCRKVAFPARLSFSRDHLAVVSVTTRPGDTVLIRILFPLELTNCNIDTLMSLMNTQYSEKTGNFFLIKCLSVLFTTGPGYTALIQILFLH